MKYIITKNEKADYIEYKNQFGERHREDGPDLEWINGVFKGHKTWRVNGKYHRVGGPAIISSNGMLEWFKNGIRHRLNAPAIIHGDFLKEFYEFGIHIGTKI
jgi:hypothetical protein